MQTPSSLSQLSHAEKDALILLLQEQITASTGKRGRPKQSKATNLIGRLRNYSDDV